MLTRRGGGGDRRLGFIVAQIGVGSTLDFQPAGGAKNDPVPVQTYDHVDYFIFVSQLPSCLAAQSIL
jgi:hypothetical protein